MTTTTIQKEFVISLENKPGTLADVATALGRADINIIGFLVQSHGEFGVARIITSDPVRTESWLKQTSRAYRLNEIIWTSVQAKPGELGRVATMLYKSGINISAIYPTENHGLAVAVDNVPSARKVLGG